MQTEPVEHRVPVSFGRVSVLVEGLAGPMTVRVPEAPVAPLNRMAPVLVPVTPRVNALAPWIVAVPVKLAALEMV